jgi:hypothetical protein
MPILSHPHTQNGELTLFDEPPGYPVTPPETILKRLNYYDGKFLRAEDLRREQEYHRRLSQLGNRAGGSGLVYGFDVTVGGGELVAIGAGLGIDPLGRVLYLPQGFSIGLQELIDRSSRVLQKLREAQGLASFVECPPERAGNGGPAPGGTDLYRISIAHAQDACGEEDVYGKLCEDPCATSTDRPYLVEGVVVRATPFQPATALADSKAVQLGERHLRSLVASAAFADEAVAGGSLISKAGLESGVWCLGARPETGFDIALAIVGRLGSRTFADEWIVRRELIETPPHRYWAWNLAMRPLAVFLAQVLQFQCQLPDALRGQGAPGTPDDPCKPQHDSLRLASRYLADIEERVAAQPATEEKSLAAAKGIQDPLAAVGGVARLLDISRQLQSVLGTVAVPSQRILVDGGIVELPAAGYLPVAPGTTPTVEEQVRRLVGDGLDLRFCIVRPDYVPHAFEAAQHMERISLLQGLDRPDAKPEVDILVPDGKRVTSRPEVRGMTFAAELDIMRKAREEEGEGKAAAFEFHGVARGDRLEPGGAALFLAGATEPAAGLDIVNVLRTFTKIGRPREKTHFDALTSATEDIRRPVERNFEDRLERTSDEAVRFLARREETPTADIGAFEVGEGRVSALWWESSSDANPFDLEPGASASIRVFAVASVPGREGTVTVFDAAGRLTPRAKAKETDEGLQLVAQFAGTSSLTTTGASGPAEEHKGSPKFPVLLTLAKSGTPRLKVEMSLAKEYDVMLTADWGGSPLAIGVDVRLQLANVLHLGDVALTENADVRDPDNALHRRSLAALPIVGAALDQPGFAKAAAAKLFPDPIRGGEQTVVATRDWVLFRRRRTIDCGVVEAPKPKPTPKPTKRYRVWASVHEPERAKQGLRENNTVYLKRYFRPVSEVAFVGGETTLSTPAADLLRDWRAAALGDLIDYAVLATETTDDPESLLIGRVKRAQEAVAAESKPATDATIEVLPPRQVLDPRGTDGVIAIVTRADIVRHEVFGVALDERTGPLFAKLKETWDAAAFKALNATSLGTIAFRNGRDTIHQSSVMTLVDAQLPPTIRDAVVLSRSDAPSGQPLDLQAKAAGREVAVAGTLAPAMVVATDDTGWPSQSPFLLVLLAEFVIN